jgi:lysyl-tRNA synthetase class 2
MRRHASDWRPGSTQQVLLARAQMLACIRGFFAGREVLEVETPLLSSCFGTDPAIEPLQSEFTGPGYAQGRPLYLQSSPEFFMKRLLADGSGPIYQVCKAFRNGEAGRLHNPEFSILEWYRPGFDALALMQEVADLVSELLGQQGLPVEHRPYAQLFQEYLGLDVFELQADDLAAFARERNLLGADGLQLDRDGWLNLLMSVLIEPQLGKEGLCFVTDYPATQASLARLNAHDPRTAARFELYYQGVELANGFEELADADEQAERFEHENCQRRSNRQMPMPVDEALLGALHHGMPECSGVALGLDRVLMCALDLDDIDEVLSFSLARI